MTRDARGENSVIPSLTLAEQVSGSGSFAAPSLRSRFPDCGLHPKSGVQRLRPAHDLRQAAGVGDVGLDADAQLTKAQRIWVMDRGILTEAVLAEMRQAEPPVHYLVGTPKGRLSKLEKALLDKPIAFLLPLIVDTSRAL